MKQGGNGAVSLTRRSILRPRGNCAILTVLLAGCLLLGLLLYSIWPKEARVYTKTDFYQAPDSELTLEVRRWAEKSDGFQGWDFVLVSPNEEEVLLERTHTMANAIITQVEWHSSAVTVYTRAPMGMLTLEWDQGAVTG